MKNVFQLISVIVISAILLAGYKTNIFSGKGLSASITEFNQIPQPDGNIYANEVSFVIEHLSQDNHVNAPYLLEVDLKSNHANSPAMNPEKLPYQLNWKTLLYFLFTKDRINTEKPPKH